VSDADQDVNVMPLKGLPPRDAPPVAGAMPPLREILHRADATPELSAQAREHLELVNAIATAALQDLDIVRNDVEKLRLEIVMRARLIAEATIEFDKLVRMAGRGYGTIRQTLHGVQARFAAAAAPVPRAPADDDTEPSGS
jgi:hypothetical protein